MGSSSCTSNRESTHYHFCRVYYPANYLMSSLVLSMASLQKYLKALFGASRFTRTRTEKWQSI